MKIEMSSWSAPGNLKPSGSLNGYDGHSKSDKTLKKANGDAYGAYAYTDFANWWKKSLEAYAAQGIVPDYVSLQNEPDMEANYEGEWTNKNVKITLSSSDQRGLSIIFLDLKMTYSLKP